MYIHLPAIEACFKLKLTPTEKMVALCCISFSDGNEFIINNEIAGFAGMCSKTFNKAINSLQKKGVIEKVGVKKYKYIFPIYMGKNVWINLGYFRVILNLNLPYHQKLTALAVVKFIDDKYQNCYPKVKTISDIVGVSERQVRKNLAELIEMGLLIRYRKFGLWYFEINDDVLTN